LTRSGPKGDIALARSAARFGIPFLLSTASNASIEEVAEHADGDLWFQLYVVHRKLAEQLVLRAMDAGYSTLVLTVDVAVNGKRERDMRNGFAMPMHYGLRSLLDGATHPRWSMSYLRHGMPQLANFISADASDTELQAALMSRQSLRDSAARTLNVCRATTLLFQTLPEKQNLFGENELLMLVARECGVLSQGLHYDNALLYQSICTPRRNDG
jgi:isopentenyl diphosphate isomerase/L-lactate dehydrogenase-like FMN-dependent dehydrogenase